ncbi:MAG: hypothetical protein ACI81V_001155 [Lentimonas sp.]|jgi:hypothetical protein
MITRFFFFIALVGIVHGREYTIYFSQSEPALNFGVRDLAEALKQGGNEVREMPLAAMPDQLGSSFVVGYTDQSMLQEKLEASGGQPSVVLQREGYSLRRTGSGEAVTYWVLGDRVGAMYGSLDLAERIRNGRLDLVSDEEHRPYLEKRGLKMNIPLDARTPSYADFSSSAQQNIPEVWSLDFWYEQLDRMARNRYNAYTLWSLHPFPSLVRLEDYPDVAKNDVMIADIDLLRKNARYHNHGTNMVDTEVLEKLVIHKRISIDEKIEFWRQVMQYGHDRGIEFHFYTWNVFTFGAEGHHGVSRKEYSGATTVDYFRQSVRALFETYPLLAGIGITAGEGFGKATDEEEEEWLFATYGEGILDLQDSYPDRQIEFVHRVWWADAGMIKDRFAKLIEDPRVDFNFSYKYSFARLYSYSGPEQNERNHIFDKVKNLPPGGRYWWNLRNDDIFNFRWGDPAFVRRFLLHLPSDRYGKGFHMGSDGYVWGREFTDLNPETPRQLEHDKHWLKYMLWGRLGYDTKTDPQVFVAEAGRRLGIDDAEALMETWALASKIVPAVNRYFWHNWDFQWSVEYNLHKGGWYDLQRWAKESRTDWAEVATGIQRDANQVLNALPGLRETGSTTDYLKTLDDIECFAHLGNFYAERIRAAHYLGADSFAPAVKHATLSAEHLQGYATLAEKRYAPQILGRSKALPWMQLYKNAIEDIPKVD